MIWVWTESRRRDTSKMSEIKPQEIESLRWCKGNINYQQVVTEEYG
jgi:hypothetical protein